MISMRSTFLTLLTTTLLISSARADELLYVFSPDCGACNRFDKEVGTVYAKTQEARVLPLVKVSFEQWQSGAHPLTNCAIGPVLGTPTFIQVAGCKELDRITGYSNDELFWIALKRMENRSTAASSAP